MPSLSKLLARTAACPTYLRWGTAVGLLTGPTVYLTENAATTVNVRSGLMLQVRSRTATVCFPPYFTARFTCSAIPVHCSIERLEGLGVLK